MEQGIAILFSLLDTRRSDSQSDKRKRYRFVQTVHTVSNCNSLSTQVPARLEIRCSIRLSYAPIAKIYHIGKHLTDFALMVARDLGKGVSFAVSCLCTASAWQSRPGESSYIQISSSFPSGL